MERSEHCSCCKSSADILIQLTSVVEIHSATLRQITELMIQLATMERKVNTLENLGIEKRND